MKRFAVVLTLVLVVSACHKVITPVVMNSTPPAVAKVVKGTAEHVVVPVGKKLLPPIVQDGLGKVKAVAVRVDHKIEGSKCPMGEPGKSKGKKQG